MRRLGMGHGRQKSEGIEIGLQVSPVAERVEYALTFAVGSVQNSGCGRLTSRFGSGCHMSATRITDAAGCVLDSHQPRVLAGLRRWHAASWGNAFINRPFNRIVITEAARVAWYISSVTSWASRATRTRT